MTEREKTLEVMARSARDHEWRGLNGPDWNAPGEKEYWLGMAEHLLTALEASGMAVVQGWQSIESAPMKESILVFIPTARHDKVRIGRCAITATGSPLWVYGGEFAFDVGKATHWRPLPASPTPSMTENADEL